MEYRIIEHSFEPVYDEYSRILILGSLPSVKSRENNFYYGHPKNRFWRVLWRIFEENGCNNETGETSRLRDSTLTEMSIDSFSIEEKKKFLHDNHIALWDVIAKCDIMGSSDSSIKNVIANDINLILDSAAIEAIYVNGTKAHELYMKYCYPGTGREAVKLPSTSPANAAWTLERLIASWSIINRAY